MVTSHATVPPLFQLPPENAYCAHLAVGIAGRRLRSRRSASKPAFPPPPPCQPSAQASESPNVIQAAEPAAGTRPRAASPSYQPGLAGGKLGGDYGVAAQQPPRLPAEEYRIFLVSDNFREAEGRAGTSFPKVMQRKSGAAEPSPATGYQYCCPLRRDAAFLSRNGAGAGQPSVHPVK
jgi:hypothetical protein